VNCIRAWHWSEEIVLLKPNPTNLCFGCGGANERGMLLAFEQDDAAQRIRGSFRLGAEYQGGVGFIHGGIIATVLDEVMGKVCRFRGVHAVTAEMTVEYLRPVPVDKDLVVEGHEVEMRGRNLFMVGEIRNVAGQVLARGKGRFVIVDRNRQVKQAAGNGTPEQLAGKPFEK
jgi:uncharacterized protein (TIGR00369 family)